MQDTLVLVLRFAFGLLSLLFWFRFILQLSDADRFNPISQAVVQASDKICSPLRKLLPNTSPLDLASLIMAFVVGIAFVLTLQALTPSGVAGISVLALVIAAFKWSIFQLTQFYFWIIIIMVIASFIAPGNYNPVLDLINQLVSPIMSRLRKVIPPFGPLDLSPMIALLVIFVIQNLVSSI